MLLTHVADHSENIETKDAVATVAALVFAGRLRLPTPLLSDSLLAQPLRTTDVWVASLVEAQFAVHVAGQTDAYTFADGARFPPARREPKRTGSAQIQAILPEINLHRLG